MSTNHFFQQNRHQGQQDLMEDLVIESIQISGVDVEYIPRNDSAGNTDEYFGEDHLADYVQHFPIEMYLQNADGYESEGELLSKFGLIIRDSGTMVVSRKRFTDETGMTKPRNGDLIYFPLSNTLFQIKYVATENPFYQFGKLYTYDLQIETYQYSGETFSTGIRKVDRIQEEQGFSLVLGITGVYGTFIKNESVTDGTASGSVRQWISSSKELRLYTVKGVFTEGRTITGSLSGATGAILSEDDMTMPEDLFADNKEIETDSDGFMDWSESTPFGDL